jgi:transcriptional regulator with XRE-family HTH domain
MQELAEKLGVSKGYVSHLEKGVRKINDDLIKRISEVLGLPENEVWKAGQRSCDNGTIANSWVSQMRINGYPVFDAFRYHLEAKNEKPDIGSKVKLKNQLTKFIRDNLPFSIIAELSENEILLDQVAEHCKK